MTARFSVEKGQLVCFRIYDAAEEFDLEAAGPALMQHAVTRATFRRVKPAHLLVHAPPLQVRMGRYTHHGLSGDVVVRAFETGVVSVSFWLELPSGVTLDDVTGHVAGVMDSLELDTAAETRVRQLMESMGPAVKAPRKAMKVMEEYTVVAIQELVEPASVDEILAQPAIAQMLLGETPGSPALSDATRRTAVQRALSYYGDDVVVIDWNAAFVYDPRGAEDVADILEFTTQQLVEFRYYDDYLDETLDRMYDEVEKHARRSFQLFGGRFAKLASELMLLRVELTEVTEKIDNSLKLVGEPFLARVYLAAVDRFRIHQWRVSVEEKLKVIDNLVGLIRGEMHTGKTLLLEVAVVVLILVELVVGVWNLHL